MFYYHRYHIIYLYPRIYDIQFVKQLGTKHIIRFNLVQNVFPILIIYENIYEAFKIIQKICYKTKMNEGERIYVVKLLFFIIFLGQYYSIFLCGRTTF